MTTNHDNPLRSRATFVGVDPDVADAVRATAGRRLEISTMANVEQLLTASGLGTLDCEVVILGHDSSEPIRLAQRIHSLDRNIQIIILAAAGKEEEFQRAIDFTPFLRDAVNLLSIERAAQLPELIRRCVKRAHRRCSYRRHDESAAVSGQSSPKGAELAQYLGSLLEHAPIGMLTLDNNGRIQTLNRRGREILGVTEREVLDTPFLSFFMPVDQIRLGRIMEGDTEYGGYFRIASEEDDVHYVEVTTSDYLSRSGQPGKMVILHEVTERVEAENARRRTAAALQASEDRLMELAEVLRLIPWEVDVDSKRFTFVGEQAEELLGYPREQWYSGDFWTQALHEKDRARAIKTRWDNCRRLQNFNHKYRIVGAEGQVLWIHDIVNVVRDRNGKPVKLRGLMVDVTEDRQLAEQTSHLG